MLGDGTAYSEGAAYGSDQSTPTYSPYSPYGEIGPDSLYKSGSPDFAARKKAILAETSKRIAKLPAYIEKKKWYEVRNELSRYMYETRGAVRGLASTPAQKAAANDFFAAIESTDGAARYKKQDECLASAKASAAALDAFVATL